MYLKLKLLREWSDQGLLYLLHFYEILNNLRYNTTVLAKSETRIFEVSIYMYLQKVIHTMISPVVDQVFEPYLSSEILCENEIKPVKLLSK